MRKLPREWSKYQYFDPEIVLPKLQAVRKKVAESNMSDKIRNLRTNTLSDHRENWDAAVFCQLMSLALGIKIFFSTEEASDFDSVFTWKDNDFQSFAPVQMKELVPEETNPNSTLQEIVNKLKKYTDSQNLVVAVKLNRRARIDFSELDFSGVQVGEIWCFGATNPDESKWSLIGNLLEGGQQYNLEWPHA